MPTQTRKLNDYFDLTNAELSSVLAAAQTEAERRTKALTEGLDAAAIIKGHESAKRAVTVACAGKHSIFFVGCPSSGKTMLRALALALGQPCTFEARPCKCGWSNHRHHACTCTTRMIEEVRTGWPQTDIFIEVQPVSTRKLEDPSPRTSLADIRRQIEQAAKHRSLKLADDAAWLLKHSEEEIGFSASTRETVIRVARTIANLDGTEPIQAQHVSEAVCYRAPTGTVRVFA